MKVLVIEDSENHQDSARQTLGDEHDLTIMTSFDEAIDAMVAPYDKEPEEVLFPYDAVLVDLKMPMSSNTLAPEAYQPSKLVPYGFVLALKAAERGADYVAVVTDTNHHQGAMSAALDHLGDAYYREGFEPNFEINGATCMFVHTPFLEEVVGTKACSTCDGSGECRCCDGTGERDDEHVQGPCNCCSDDNPGVCTRCEGSGERLDIREEKKDWGQILEDLTQ